MEEYRLLKFRHIWWVTLVIIIVTYVALNVWSPDWLFRTVYSIEITPFGIFSFVILLAFLFFSCASSVMVKTTQTDQTKIPGISPFTAIGWFFKHWLIKELRTLPLIPLCVNNGEQKSSPIKAIPEEGLRRSRWQPVPLFVLLVLVLFGGYWLARTTIEATSDTRHVLFFAIVAFSIAFAIHYFSVSISLCNLTIQESRKAVQCQLRQLEYSVVSSGLLVLAGGLTLLLSGAVSLLIRFNLLLPILSKPSIVAVVYTIGASMLCSGYCRYTLGQSGWPRAAARIRDP